MKLWILVPGFIFVILPYPFPAKNEFFSSVSPDKTRIAQFYWKGSGVAGVITRDNPWVYLEINDLNTGKVTGYDIWADTPCDGVESIENHIAWKMVHGAIAT